MMRTDLNKNVAPIIGALFLVLGVTACGTLGDLAVPERAAEDRLEFDGLSGPVDVAPDADEGVPIAVADRHDDYVPPVGGDAGGEPIVLEFEPPAIDGGWEIGVIDFGDPTYELPDPDIGIVVVGDQELGFPVPDPAPGLLFEEGGEELVVAEQSDDGSRIAIISGKRAAVAEGVTGVCALNVTTGKTGDCFDVFLEGDIAFSGVLRDTVAGDEVVLWTEGACFAPGGPDINSAKVTVALRPLCDFTQQ